MAVHPHGCAPAWLCDTGKRGKGENLGQRVMSKAENFRQGGELVESRRCGRGRQGKEGGGETGKRGAGLGGGEVGLKAAIALPHHVCRARHQHDARVVIPHGVGAAAGRSDARRN
eukprot:276979-Chlamydomonas_euryale.AAC.1